MVCITIRNSLSADHCVLQPPALLHTICYSQTLTHYHLSSDPWDCIHCYPASAPTPFCCTGSRCLLGASWEATVSLSLFVQVAQDFTLSKTCQQIPDQVWPYLLELELEAHTNRSFHLRPANTLVMGDTEIFGNYIPIRSDTNYFLAICFDNDTDIKTLCFCIPIKHIYNKYWPFNNITMHFS